MLHDDWDYEDRMFEKEVVEGQMWEAIRQVVPWQIQKASVLEDMGGIDGWWDHFVDGRTCAFRTVQLKIRQSGDDVLLECVKPWPGDGFTGRDMRIVVDWYFCVDREGVLRVYRGETLHKIAKELVGQLRGLGGGIYRGELGEVKVVRDPSRESSFGRGKVKKVVAFIRTDRVKPVYEFQLRFN